jgi:hypothetical protein
VIINTVKQIIGLSLCIIYFSISKRVKETFIEEKNFGFHFVISIILPIILFFHYSNKLDEIKLKVSSNDSKIIENKNTIEETTYTNENNKLMIMINTKTNKFGLIDKNAKWIVEPIFDNITDFKEELAGVKINNKYGFIDRKGNFVIQPIFDDIKDFAEELAGVRINNKWGFIDKKGNFIINPQYDRIQSFSNGLSIVEKEFKKGIIDKKETIIVPLIYMFIDDMSEGLFKVTSYDKFNFMKKGFIDLRGNIIIPPIYEYADDFSEGVASVKINDK